MTPTRRRFAALSLGLPIAWTLARPAHGQTRSPPPPPRPALVIAAGGAIGDAPAETAGAYDQAIRDGADFLAADFVPTKDGILVARRDHELSATTDVASRPEFAARRGTRTDEGGERTGWFVEDFTLAELKTLACGGPGGRRRGPPAAVLTFDELTAVARAGSVRTARVIGVLAGMPQPAYFAGIDLPLEARLADAIRGGGYNAQAAAMIVASGSGEALKTIGELTRARRVFRLKADGAGAVTPETLTSIRPLAWGVAADAGLLLDLTNPRTIAASALIGMAHDAGLAVHGWTGGAGAPFPPPPLRQGDARRTLTALMAAGCDGVAGDLAAPIARARDDLYRDRD